MKKTTVIAIIVMLLSVGFLCGCNDTPKTEDTVDKDSFIGTWRLIDVSYDLLKNLLDEQPHLWEIMENGSIKQTVTHYNDPNDESDFYTSISWSIWELTDEKFNMGNETAMIPYDYQFSNSYSELSLTYSESVWSKLEKT